ncbi:MAG: glycosyltransferase, partial [Cyanobacteria bacterium HKST-UBA02]|nr:glycosyltransferase [Cyanobacteria bacterium HKST-UBA02]
MQKTSGQCGHNCPMTQINNSVSPIVPMGVNWTRENQLYRDISSRELRKSLVKPELSIVIPVFNEEDNVELLYEKLLLALTACGRTWEVIFIDDGSSDQSFAELGKLVAQDHRLRVVKFVRNYGQTAALAAGIDYARGRVIIPMDADLQNDPGDIQMLLDKMDEGYD